MPISTMYDYLRIEFYRHLLWSPYRKHLCLFSSPLLPGRNVSWGMPWAARAVSAAHSCGASSKPCWAAPVILVESYCKLVC